MTLGRPLLFNNKEELENKIQDFLNVCKDEDIIPTISGLAVHLNTSRETLCNYEKKEEFFDTVKGAKDKVIALQEQLAMKGKINPTVWIFSAKNNLGYSDRQEMGLDGGLDENNKPLPLLANVIHRNNSTPQDSQPQ